jgi:hypothetical protein
MSFRCPESSLLRHLTRGAWYRCVGGSRQWHNRGFASGQTIETDDLGFTIRWRGHGEVRARNLRTLSMPGRFASVLASGPSVRALRRPERIFDHPVCCVNGSASLAADLGRQVDCCVVSDYRFILEKPDLFRVVTRVARAVVLNPMSIFTAMLTVPDALEEASLFMREDLRRPFKRLQPTAAELADDPGLITNATGDLAFALDPSLGTFPAGTVVFDALQILFGIGCREVFMFGVDLTDGPRFYRESRPAKSELAQAYERRIEPAFALVAEYLRRTGRSLVNGAAGSRLPDTIIPKVDGNELLDRLAGRTAADAARFRPAA